MAARAIGQAVDLMPGLRPPYNPRAAS